jgi:formiminotetrahydrofolate cyclodeaminase
MKRNLLHALRKLAEGESANFISDIKKAAANAAAKVRRWIKELQINVSEHRGDESRASIPLNFVANRFNDSA